MLKNNCLLGKMIGLLANVQLKSDYSENEINYGGKKKKKKNTRKERLEVEGVISEQ